MSNVDQASQAQPDQRRGDRYTGPLHCHRSALRLPDNNAVDRTIWLDNQTLRVIIEAKPPVTAAFDTGNKMGLLKLIFGYPIIGIVLFGSLSAWFTFRFSKKNDSPISEAIGEVSIFFIGIIALVISTILAFKKYTN